MKLAVFGATGKTGQYLLPQALEAGHEVIALVRSPDKMTMQDDNLLIVQGDILHAEAVDAVIHDADAVISVLGPTSNKPEFVVSQGMTHILDAMRRHNVRRLIISVGAGVRDPQDKPGLPDKAIGFLLRMVSRNVLEDMKQVVEQVRQSDTDWTIVRVPMLTNQLDTSNVRIGYLGQDVGVRLARKDLASFMLEQLTDDRYIRKAPVISN